MPGKTLSGMYVYYYVMMRKKRDCAMTLAKNSIVKRDHNRPNHFAFCQVAAEIWVRRSHLLRRAAETASILTSAWKSAMRCATTSATGTPRTHDKNTERSDSVSRVTGSDTTTSNSESMMKKLSSPPLLVLAWLNARSPACSAQIQWQSTDRTD